MAGYGTPDWVNPQNNANASAAVSEVNLDPGVTAGSGGQNGQGSVRGRGGCLLSMLSLLNMGLAVMMAALGVLTIIAVHVSGVETIDDDAATDDAAGGGGNNNRRDIQPYNLSEPFLAFYMILFAVLLFMYELMWWSPLTVLNDNMRKNFGFMYGLRGKGLYLVFVAFLCFGLGKDARVMLLNYFTGISFLVVGCLHIFILCTKPEIAAEYQPPGRASTASSAPADEVSQNVV